MSKRAATGALPRTTLLLVDDHFFVRAGLTVSLNREPDLIVVGEAGDGEEAMEQYRTLRPDVVLMDGKMPRRHGSVITSDLCAAFPEARILLLSIEDAEEPVARALRAGARGYVTKAASRQELLRAIRSIAAGEVFISPALAAGQQARAAREPLTHREEEVLELLVRGLPNKHIAAELHITEVTIKTHLSHLFQKLGVEDRTSATLVALQRGLVRGE